MIIFAHMWTKKPQNVDLLTLKVQVSSLWLGFHACKCAMKWENILSNFENCVKCSKSGLYYCSWSPTWVFPAYIIVLNQLRIHSWQKVLATTILWGLSLPILDLTQMTWCLLVLRTWVGTCAKSKFRLCWMTLWRSDKSLQYMPLLFKNYPPAEDTYLLFWFSKSMSFLWHTRNTDINTWMGTNQ